MKLVVFEMQNSGLEEVKNPSEFLLNGRPENASGLLLHVLWRDETDFGGDPGSGVSE